MSTQIQKPPQHSIGIPKATGLQEHADTIQTHKVIKQTNERNNGLQNINGIEDPPWYRLPSQEFQKGKRGKNFNYTQSVKLPTKQIESPIQIEKQKFNGLQDFDEVFPKNIHAPNKNKNSVTRLDSDIAKTTETTEAKNEHQDKSQNLLQSNNKNDLRKQIHRQTLNGVLVASSPLHVTKSQTSVSSKSLQEKRVETSDSCKREVRLNESQTSISSKYSQEKKVETSDPCENELPTNESQKTVSSKCPKEEKVKTSDSSKDQTFPDKSYNQENLKNSPNNSEDQEKKKKVVKRKRVLIQK